MSTNFSSFADETAAYIAAHGEPDRIELFLTDINAIARGKWLPGDAIDRVESGGVKLPISTYALNIHGEEVEETGLGIVVGDPDGAAYPALGSLKPCPWLDGHVAQAQIALCDDAGEMSPFDGRGVLSRMVDRLKARGLTAVVAMELEFYLFQPRAHAEHAPEPPAHSLVAQTFDMEVCRWFEPMLKEIQDAARAQGLPTDTLIAEYGPGQFEVNFMHVADAVAAADYALRFRRLVRGVASKHGYAATFMAKPYADSPGNGMHAHISLINDAGENVLSGAATEDAPGYRLAQPMRNAVAGLLQSMAPLQAIFAPHLNSYRRFQPNSFAPCAPDWGVNNRGAAVRLPAVTGKAARFEHRISGADVNPYLALAAILGGALHGMETGAEPPLPLDDPQAEAAAPLAQNWSEAVNAFEASPLAVEIFGAAFVKVYCALRRNEMALIGGEITPAEYRAYLNRL